MVSAMGQSDAQKAFDDQKYEDALEVWNKLLEENP
jgi:cytochrome c-type biogenesis protein CcmH/NrfG